MKPEIKTKWVAALRSGEYTQASGELVENAATKRFCCLGVLSDLSAIGEWVNRAYITSADLQEESYLFTVEEWEYRVAQKQYNSGETEYAHTEVVSWAGLNSENPELVVPYSLLENYGFENPAGAEFCNIDIAELNDQRVPFSVLADLIEEQL